MSLQYFMTSALSEVSTALKPVKQALTSPAAFGDFLAGVGYVSRITDLQEVQPKFQVVVQACDALTAAIEIVGKLREGNEPDLTKIFEAVKAVTTAAGNVAQAIRDLNAVQGLGALPAPLNTTAFWQEFSLVLFDTLLHAHLESQFPVLFGLLKAVGVLSDSVVAHADSESRRSFRQRIVHWDRFGSIIAHPENVLDIAYGFDHVFEHQRFIDNVVALAKSIGLPASKTDLSEESIVQYYGGTPQPNLQQAVVPLYWDAVASGRTFGYASLDIVVVPIPAEGNAVATPIGFAIYPALQGRSGVEFAIGTSTRATLMGGFDAEPVRLNVRPSDFSVVIPADLGLQVDADATLSVAPPTPFLLLGLANSTRLEIANFGLGLSVRGPASDLEYQFGFGLGGGSLLIYLSESDGFLQSALPKEGIKVSFDLRLGWSSKRGFYFAGNADLEAILPVHIDILGVLNIQSIFIALKSTGAGENSAVELVSAATIGLSLGPVRVVIDRLGLSLRLTFPKSGGNLGSANFVSRFNPPRSLGFVIDAKAVVGGGFLLFDPEKEQYAGVLHLEVKGGISIKAIGLITTRMPDGSAGFSLLILVAVEFSPIQLGYGFTLNGVGGLAAFNRTMVLKALQDGVRNRTLDSIMFPPDPVANSTKIISDLQGVFPVAPGRFVFAPMVKIGWGSSILVIEIGLAVELPSPLRLALMGKVHLLLPPAGADKSGDERVPIELHMAVLGTLDFDEGEIYVTASLYNSFIAIFPVTGGMVTRIRWGRDPVFLLSVGGFNPRFTPPPGMDPVDRVGIQLSYDKEGVRAALRLESYFALTANSFQMGARLDAYAEVVKIATLRGYLGFDALIESPPFHFVVDLFGGVEVRAFGFGFACDLLLTLSGPGPVEGNGYVKIEFLGEHRVEVHFLIGEPAPEPPLPLVDPYEELILALKDRRNWTATPPDNARMFVTLRQVTAAEVGLGNAEADAPPPLLVHPLGELSVRQRVLPFGLRLERFGGATPSSPGPFAIASFDVAGNTVSPGADDELRDAFARGQFSRLTDDQKLTLPAFEPMICGYRHLVNDEVAFGAHQDTDFDLDVIVIDDKAQPPAQTIRIALLDAALERGTQCGAARIMSPPPPIGGKFAGPTAGISVTGPRYAAASKDTLQASAKRYSTHAEAEADEELRGPSGRRFQVVEEYEIA